MIHFIETYVKLIANYPDIIRLVEHQPNEKLIEVTLYAHASDMGKLIGKNGNMINAIKTMANGCKAKNGISYKIHVLDIDQANF